MLRLLSKISLLTALSSVLFLVVSARLIAQSTTIHQPNASYTIPIWYSGTGVTGASSHVMVWHNGGATKTISVAFLNLLHDDGTLTINGDEFESESNDGHEVASGDTIEAQVNQGGNWSLTRHLSLPSSYHFVGFYNANAMTAYSVDNAATTYITANKAWYIIQGWTYP